MMQNFFLLPKQPANSIGLIGHTIANYPSPEIVRDAIKVMVTEGVDLIEIQIPFSEPMADGPVFMKANHDAIAKGVTLAQSFELMQEVSSDYKIPFVFMTYANIVYKYGFENFIKRAKAVGAKGLIIPDLPIDDAQDYLQLCERYAFAPIQIIPPNVSEERLQLLLAACSGFVYIMARSGVTGTKTELGNDIAALIKRVRQYTDLPIAIGFGISLAQDIQFLKPYADYAIIGTQAMRTLQDQGLEGLEKFWRELKDAT